MFGRSIGWASIRQRTQQGWGSPVLTSWGSIVSQLLMLIGVLPLVLIEFNAEEVRFWLLLNTLLIFNMVCDLGIAPTMTRIYAYAMGGAELSELGEQTASSKRIQRAPSWDTVEAISKVCQRTYFLLAIALFFMLGAFGTWILAPLFSNLPSPLDGWISCLLFFLAQPFGLLSGKYTAYLTGTNHIPEIQRLRIAVSLTTALLMLGVLWSGFGLAALVAASQCAVLALFFGNRYLAKHVNDRRYEDSLFGRYHVDVGRVVWPRAWRSALGQIFTAGITQLAAAYYARGVNAGSAAEYLLALRIMGAIAQFSDVPFYTKLPKMSVLRGQGDVAGLAILARARMGVSLSLLSLGILSFMLLGDPLLERLGAEVRNISTDLWLSLGVATYLHRYGSMHLQVFSTTNKIMWHWVSFFSAVVFVAITSVLFPSVGLRALPVAMVLGYGTVYSPWSSILSHRSLTISAWSFEKRAGLPGIAILLLGAIGLMWFTETLPAERNL